MYDPSGDEEGGAPAGPKSRSSFQHLKDTLFHVTPFRRHNPRSEDTHGGHTRQTNCCRRCRDGRMFGVLSFVFHHIYCTRYSSRGPVVWQSTTVVTSGLESPYSRTPPIVNSLTVPIYGNTPYKGTVPIQGDSPFISVLFSRVANAITS